MSDQKQHTSDITRVNSIVDRVQKVLLECTDAREAVDVLAIVMITMGCGMNNMSGEITTTVLEEVNRRYHSRESKKHKLADALILQGTLMRRWDN